MNAKAKVTRSGRKARRTLEARGWYVTWADGRIGPWDLVALRPEHGVKLVRVKTNEDLGRAERAELIAFICHETWAKEVWVYQDHTRIPLILRVPHPPPLTFLRVDLCDGCGMGLDPESWLWGLCAACQDPTSEERGDGGGECSAQAG